MNVLILLILASLVVALVFLTAFMWAVKSGQFDDTCTPSMRILTDDVTNKISNSSKDETKTKS